MTKKSQFDGNDLTQWIQHFSLQFCGLEAVLREKEVHDVQDLRLVCEDEGLLEEICQRIGSIGAKKFRRALARTTSLTSSADLATNEAVGKGPSSPIEETTTTITHREEATDVTQNSTFFQQTKENSSSQTVRYSKAQKRTKKILQEETMSEEKKMSEIEKLHADLEQACSKDLTFLVDCTGSMERFLPYIKHGLADSVEAIRQLHPLLKLRIAFVGYRDFDVDEDQLSVHAFTEDASSVCTFLRSQRPMGGVDGAEDVLGGLEQANQLDWRSVERILYHIADAPCHGAAFHDSKVTDNYASAYGPADYERVLVSLYDKKIKYFFGRIKASTDVMIAAFNQLVDVPNFILETPVGKPHEMMTVVRNTLINYISQSLSHTGRVLTGTQLNDFLPTKLDLNEPYWDGLEVEDVSTYNMIVPSQAMSEVVRGANDHCVDDKLIIGDGIMIAKQPFAAGGLHNTHYGKIVDNKDKALVKRDVVLKFLPESSIRLPCERLLTCYSTASFMAKQFNNMLNEVVHV